MGLENEKIQGQLDDINRKLEEYAYQINILIAENKKTKCQLDDLQKDYSALAQNSKLTEIDLKYNESLTSSIASTIDSEEVDQLKYGSAEGHQRRDENVCQVHCNRKICFPQQESSYTSESSEEEYVPNVIDSLQIDTGSMYRCLESGLDNIKEEMANKSDMFEINERMTNVEKNLELILTGDSVGITHAANSKAMCYTTPEFDAHPFQTHAANSKAMCYTTPEFDAHPFQPNDNNSMQIDRVSMYTCLKESIDNIEQEIVKKNAVDAIKEKMENIEEKVARILSSLIM